MRLGKKGRNVILLVVGLVLGGLLAAYFLACRVPGYYKPARLTATQRDLAMREFRRHLMDFNNDGQNNQPFTWSVTQQQLNGYLAAMDEIAFQGGADAGAAHRAMESAGIAEPAVALDDGHVRLMARSLDYNKIVSVDIGLAVGADGQLHVSLDGARIGRLPIPASMVRSMLGKFQGDLSRRGGVADSAPAMGGLDSAEVGRVLGKVMSAIDGKPIPTELSWRVMSARKRFRVTTIDIRDGTLTLHMTPVLDGERGRE